MHTLRPQRLIKAADVEAQLPPHVMLAKCRRLPSHLILRACGYASLGRLPAAASAQLHHLHHPNIFEQRRVPSLRCHATGSGGSNGSQPNRNGASADSTPLSPDDVTQPDGQPQSSSSNAAADAPRWDITADDSWLTSQHGVSAINGYRSCRWFDRNLARQYGISNEMLQSVMDMPHSQAQSMEQVRCHILSQTCTRCTWSLSGLHISCQHRSHRCQRVFSWDSSTSTNCLVASQLATRVKSLGEWKACLQRGVLPDAGAIPWPSEPLSSTLANVLSDLEMPRFCRRFPTLLNTVLNQMVGLIRVSIGKACSQSGIWHAPTVSPFHQGSLQCQGALLNPGALHHSRQTVQVHHRKHSRNCFVQPGVLCIVAYVQADPQGDWHTPWRGILGCYARMVQQCTTTGPNVMHDV